MGLDAAALVEDLVYSTVSKSHQADDGLGGHRDAHQEWRADASIGEEGEIHTWFAEELHTDLACRCVSKAAAEAEAEAEAEEAHTA